MNFATKHFTLPLISLSLTSLSLAAATLLVALLNPGPLCAHQITFNSSLTYAGSQPAGGAASVANWTGAAFDADNIGGSGVNANGTPNNGAANDASTYVANNQPVPGQSFLTGSAANGYKLNAITVRMAGYSNNVASGTNNVSWNLLELNGPIILTLCEINGTNRTVLTMQNFKAGDLGNPGSGNSANGPGTYLTFHLPFTTCLKSNMTYGFEIAIGNGSANYFEWLGTRDPDAFATGTAYSRAWWGGPLTPLTGDRVFMVDLTALAAAPTNFTHPCTLHTQADLNRMKAKVLASQQPWLSGYNMLLSSPYNNLGWPAYNVDYIVRGSSGNNYTRSQQDAQLIYTLTLLWHMTGDTNYANRAVQIANVWSDLLGIQGDSNQSLAAGICGYLFASAGELLSTYPGWAETEKQAYKDMMMRVFYPANFDFLWRHHDTFINKGGNTHYRLNWDTANMASMAAIGILCDNRAVYEQAVDYFKAGPGNGRVERAAWYLHPGGLGQGEEAGRDQGHNLGGWHAMALLCQMAWNQGDDLFGYDNNRVLRVFEYNAKYNLGNDVPYARHQTCDLGYTEGTVSGAGRGLGYYQYELVYNHYVNLKGIAAPWSQLAAAATRPEPWPNTGLHPSQVDWFGLGTLTYTRETITTDQPPSGLRANWSKNQVLLDWWGSARATNYLVRRAAASAGPYTQIGTVAGPDLNFADTNVLNGSTNFYLVTAQAPSGNLDSAPLRVAQELVTRYTFEGNANDVAGARHATLKGGSTGLPGYATGFGGGQAIDLDGVDDYVQMPVGVANYQDLTLAAWVQWDGGANWQRVFDIGTEIEKTMYLTPKNGSGFIEFGFTTTKGGNVVGDASYYLAGPALSVGVWTHVAVTLNGDVATLYVNGVPRSTQVVDLIDPLFGQVFCYLGKSIWNADPLFNGRIDDFRIYNYALSGAGVYALWGQSANHAPKFSTDPVNGATATEDVNYAALNLSLTATDADGGTLVYSKLSGPAWLTVNANGLLSGTPSNADVGQNYFVVRVTDAVGATDDAALRIPVQNANDAPTWTLNPIEGGGAVAGHPYSFSIATGYAADVDVGDSASFSKISGPAWLNVSSTGALTGVPLAANAGTNNFTVRVTDAAGAFADAAFRVVVSIPADAAVAHWNFEEGTADAYVPYAPASAGQYDGSLRDVSVFGNHLSAWSTSWEWYRTNVPAAITPQTGVTNRCSVQNANNFNAMSAIGTALTNWNPAQWTIEAAFMTDRTTGFQTLVGRDSLGAYAGNAALSALYLSVRPGGSVAVQFTDSAGNNWNLASATGIVEVNQWQALAAVSDGATLALYLKNVTASEPHYTRVATLSLASSTNTALAKGTGDGADWDAGVITVGRGLYNGGHTDRLFGYIDDVRLSGAALTTNQFLYSPPLPPAAPTGVSAIGADSQVTLTWNAVNNATGYKVKRAATSGGSYVVISSPINPNFTDTGLFNGTAYYYVVSAMGIGGESLNSSEVLGRPVSLIAPELHITRDSTQIQIEWPATHTGWRLEAQTNSLATGGGANWFTVAGGALTNQLFIPIHPASGSFFFRLVYP